MITKRIFGLLLVAPILAGCGTADRELLRTSDTVRNPFLAQLYRWSHPLPEAELARAPAPAPPPAMSVPPAAPTSVRIEAPRTTPPPGRGTPADEPAAAPEEPSARPSILVQPGAQVRVTHSDATPEAATPDATAATPGAEAARAAAAGPRPPPAARQPAATHDADATRDDSTGTRLRRIEGRGWEVL
ncbi:hypothetical protein [Salinarimonas chemoclinalis]|uniref:hypothetical protein n=1 Tax=Salinarimonas chemoclinalis TaxID=3241599 RepID=UPI003558C397